MKWKHHNGDIYDGDTHDEDYHGYGTLTTSNHKYEGNWKNGKKKGKFIVTNLKTKEEETKHY